METSAKGHVSCGSNAISAIPLSHLLAINALDCMQVDLLDVMQAYSCSSHEG